MKVLKKKLSTLKAEMNIKKTINSSELFCAEWYEEQYPEIKRAGHKALDHFIKIGVKELKNPSGKFNTRHYVESNLDVFINGMNPLFHYEKFGREEKRKIIDADLYDNLVVSELGKVDLKQACKVVERSGQFDRDYYLKENEDVAHAKIDPLLHYCKWGWKELRNPSPAFDSWDYCCQFLNFRSDYVNPLLHSVVTGNKFVSKKIKLSDGINFSKDTPPRRICLFAAYDADNVIDESVIKYVNELSRHADVYYLADSNMQQSELDKLNSIVKGAWALRHGEYDFGSYSRLALKLVGWDIISQYDELILANDSCYLLNSLDDAFDKMNNRKCDWWGLQATKGAYRTRDKESNAFKENIAIEQVKSELLDSYEQEEIYDFHIGSYFLVFRKPVIKSKELKGLLSVVQKEKHKFNIIKKYEFGLTRNLIRAGYSFDTFIDDLYTFHPIYSENHFELIKQGFPLFKRFLLTENHYNVPELWRWEQKLKALRPKLDLGVIKKNLLRIADNAKLYRNLNIKVANNGISIIPALLTDSELIEKDKKIEKNDNWWIFPVCAYDNNLSGNERALFEYVKDNEKIKKIILTRKNHVALTGKNVEVVPLRSPEGQDFLLKSRVIFVKHTAYRNTLSYLSSEGRYFINLWHGIPLKKIGYASLDMENNLEALTKEHSRLHSVICSSDIDALAMSAAFYPLSIDKMWLTGLPRIDTILKEEEVLPADLKQELSQLQELVSGRKLVLFCPTFKNGQEGSYYTFSETEKQRLNDWLLKNNMVLGVRVHMADSAGSYLNDLADLEVVNLGSKLFPNIELLYRKAELLITDYSSCFIDFMVTGKPVISFAYDHDNYLNKERGFFYDLDYAVPGPVCKTFDKLMIELLNFSSSNVLDEVTYMNKQKLFFKYIDCDNSKRLFDKVCTLLEVESGK